MTDPLVLGIVGGALGVCVVGVLFELSVVWVAALLLGRGAAVDVTE